MATIGSLQVNIVAGTAGFEKGIRRAQSLLGGFANKASLIGGGIAAALGGALKMFESAGSELHDMSAATGIAVDQLSFLKYAATQSGSSLEAITKAARELQTQGIDPNKFESIAASIAKITDPTMRAQKAFAIFGKKVGSAILPMLEDIPALRKRFEQLGGGWTKKMADAADRLGDSWGDVRLVLGNVGNHIAFVFAPTIARLSEWIAENGRAIADWIDNHRGLITVVGATAATLTTLAPALISASSAVYIMSKAVGVLNVAMWALSASPVMRWVLGVSAAVVALVAVLEKFFGLWTKFKKAIGMGDDSLGGGAQSKFAKSAQAPRALTSGGASGSLGASPSVTPVATSSSSNNEVAQNTAAINDSMKILIAEMKRQNGEGKPQSHGEPIQLVTAGVR